MIIRYLVQSCSFTISAEVVVKQRKHHKVGKDSVYYNPAIDARWPICGHFVRLARFLFVGLVWKTLLALRRFLQPGTLNFYKRFQLLLLIEVSLVSWNGVLYFFGNRLPFSRDWVDLAVVVEVLVAVPLSFFINRLIDWKIKDRRMLGQIPLFLDIIVFTISPAWLIYVWIFRPIVLGLCRLFYGRPYEPRWLD